MTEGTVVKVIDGAGLPAPHLIGSVGRVIGHYKKTPIVVVRKDDLLSTGSAWAIPENCLEIVKKESTDER